jgi:hypothetical protein
MDKKIALVIMLLVIAIQAIHFGCKPLITQTLGSISITETSWTTQPALPTAPITPTPLMEHTPSPSTAWLLPSAHSPMECASSPAWPASISTPNSPITSTYWSSSASLPSLFSYPLMPPRTSAPAAHMPLQYRPKVCLCLFRELR